jgi:outer membrane protein assembly factor BamB
MDRSTPLCQFLIALLLLQGRLQSQEPGTLLWRISLTGNEILACPSQGPDGMIYLATHKGGGVLYKIDPADGRVLAQVQCAGQVEHAPAVGDNGLVYVVTLRGTIASGASTRPVAAAYRTEDLSLVWETQLKNGADTSPVLGNGRVWAGLVSDPRTPNPTAGQRYYALDMESGKAIVDMYVEGWAATPGAVDDQGRVFFGVEDLTGSPVTTQEGEIWPGVFYALTGADPVAPSTTAELAWPKFKASGDFGAPVSFAEGSVFTTCRDGYLYGFEQSSGQIVLQHDLGAPSWTGTTIGRDRGNGQLILYTGTQNIDIGRNGQGKLVAVRLDGSLGGQRLWTQKVPGGMTFGNPCIDDEGNLYYTTSIGAVQARDSEGQLLWEHAFTEGGGVAGPTLLDDGKLLAASNGYLTAFQSFGQHLADDVPWPKYKHDLQATSNATHSIRFEQTAHAAYRYPICHAPQNEQWQASISARTEKENQLWICGVQGASEVFRVGPIALAAGLLLDPALVRSSIGLQAYDALILESSEPLSQVQISFQSSVWGQSLTAMEWNESGDNLEFPFLNLEQDTYAGVALLAASERGVGSLTLTLIDESGHTLGSRSITWTGTYSKQLGSVEELTGLSHRGWARLHVAASSGCRILSGVHLQDTLGNLSGTPARPEGPGSLSPIVLPHAPFNEQWISRIAILGQPNGSARLHLYDLSWSRTTPSKSSEFSFGPGGMAGPQTFESLLRGQNYDLLVLEPLAPISQTAVEFSSAQWAHAYTPLTLEKAGNQLLFNHPGGDGDTISLAFATQLEEGHSANLIFSCFDAGGTLLATREQAVQPGYDRQVGSLASLVGALPNGAIPWQSSLRISGAGRLVGGFYLKTRGGVMDGLDAEILGTTPTETTIQGSVQVSQQSGNALRFDVLFSTDRSVPVTLQAQSSTGNSPLIEGNTASSHHLVLYGLKENTTYDLLIQSGSGSSRQTLAHIPAAFTSSALPAAFVSVERETGSASRAQAILLDTLTGQGAAMLVLDATGEIIWYQTMDAGSRIDGFCLSDRNTVVVLLNQNRLVEYDFAGNLLRDWRMKEAGGPFLAYPHHDVIDRQGTTTVIVAKSQQTGTGETVVYDGVQVYDHAGNLLLDWDLLDAWSLDLSRGNSQGGGYWSQYFGPQAIDWAHANGLTYDENDNWVLSLRHFHQVITVETAHLNAVGPGFGQISAILGEGGEYQLDPSGATTTWFKGQHAPNFDSAGHLILFDNGTANRESRVLLLDLDSATGSANALAAIGLGLSCSSISSAYPLGDGWFLADCGPKSTVMEVHESGQIAWQVHLNPEDSCTANCNKTYRALPIADFFQSP